MSHRAISLIEELREVSVDAEGAALVIGFESSTIFVWSHDSDALDTLNACVDAGGHPVGLLRWFRDVKGIQVQARTLEEFAGDEHFRKYLNDLLSGFRKELLKLKC